MPSSAALELILLLKDQASVSLKRVSGELVDLDKQHQALGKQATAAFAKMDAGVGAAANVLGKLAIPMAAAGIAAGKLSVDFDESLHNINSIAGLSQAELGKLGDSFVSLSLDANKTFEGASALATGFYDIQSSGFAGADGMKVLEASTKAASAGMSNTQTAAGAITATLNAYGESADDAAHVSDVLFQTVNLGVINFEQLAGSIGRVIPSAAAAKIPIEQVGAAISTMTKSGLAGAQAVTDLNSLISNVIKPSKEAGDAASAMGLDFSFAALQAKGLSGFMADVMHATGGNAEAMGKLFTSQEALTAALSITKGEMKGFNADLEGMNNAAGKTDAAFQEMSRSTSAQFQRLKANFEALGVTVGSEILPRVNDAVGSVNEMVTAFTKLPKNEQQRWVDIAVGVGGATIAMYGFTKATQGLIATWEAGAKVFGGIRAAAGLVSGSLGVLAIPLAAVGALVAVGVHDWNAYSDALNDQTKALDDHNETLTGAAAVQQRFADSLAAATPAGQAQLTLITQLQAEHANLQHQIVEQEGLSSPFGVNEELERLKGLLKANEAELDKTASHMDDMTSSTERAQAMLSEQATVIKNTGSAFQSMSQAAVQGLSTVHTSVLLLPEEIAALDKALADTTTAGIAAFSELLTSSSTFQQTRESAIAEHEARVTEITAGFADARTDKEKEAVQDRLDAENTGFAQQEQDAAVAYANQAAAQKAALGQQLIDYVTAQATLHNVTGEKLAELTGKIATEYNIQKSISQTTFEAFKTDADRWAAGTGVSADKVINDLHLSTTAAENLKEAEDKMTGVFVSQLNENFPEGARHTQEYLDKLAAIPGEVHTLLTSNFYEQSVLLAGINAQMANLPKSKAIQIALGIDPQLKQNSPSLLQLQMREIDEFAARTHTMKIDTAGIDRLKDMMSLLGSLGGAVGGLQALAGYDEGSLYEDAIGGFAEDTARVVQALIDTSRDFNAKAIEAAGKYASAAGTVLGLVKTGIDAIVLLQTYNEGELYEDAVYGFANDTKQIVNAFWVIADSMMSEGVTAAAAYTEGASKVLSIITDGVAAIASLRDYDEGSLYEDAVYGFAHDVKQVINAFWTVADSMQTEGVDAAGAFATGAATSLGIISTGVAAIAALRDYDEGALFEDAVYGFAADVKRVVNALWTVADSMMQEGVDAAAEFATGAGKSIAIVGSSVDAFTKLQDYSGIPEQAMDAFARDLHTVVLRMVEMAAMFEQEGVDAAAAWSDSVGKIIAPISAAVQAFESVNDYEGVAPAAMQLLMNDMLGVVSTLVIMDAALDAEGVTAAAAIAEKEQTIFESLSAGLSFFKDLSERKPGDVTAQVGLLLSDMTEVQVGIENMKTFAAIAAVDVLAWKVSMESIIRNVKATGVGFSSLDGLNIDATVTFHLHQQTKVDGTDPRGGGTGGGGNPDPGWGIPIEGARATGGPVMAGLGYLVKEREDEYFFPSVDGIVVPESKMGGTGGHTYVDASMGDINVTVQGGTSVSSKDLGRQFREEVQKLIDANYRAWGSNSDASRRTRS